MIHQIFKQIKKNTKGAIQMSTPNYRTVETVIELIDYLESTSNSYMQKTGSLHYQMLTIASLADSATYKECRIVADNYTNKLLKQELTRLERK